jgi:glycosyltransferase involved in cell wall biosynthesis
MTLKVDEPKKIIGKTKVIIVIPSLDMGGAEKQALQFACYLKQEHSGSFDVSLFGFFNPGIISQSAEKSKIPWRLVPYPGSHFFPFRLVNLVRLLLVLRKNKPDIILPYTYVPNVICGLLWRWTGAKLCLWNQRDGGVHYDIQFLEKRAVKNSTDFVSNSHQGANYLTKEFGIRPEAIKIIPNGVELSPPQRTRSAWRTSLKLDERTPVVCMVANLTGLKDHQTLLRSWKIVVDSIRNETIKPILLLAGKEYEMYHQLAEFVHSNNIQGNVRFLGQVDDISGLLASADVAVYSSKQEGCPNGLLECMAAGLPVIATDIPANREAMGGTRNECFFPVGDVDALVEKIRLFLSDKNIREQEGIMNRTRIHEKFSNTKTNEETMNFILSRYPIKIEII